MLLRRLLWIKKIPVEEGGGMQEFKRHVGRVKDVGPYYSAKEMVKYTLILRGLDSAAPAGDHGPHRLCYAGAVLEIVVASRLQC